MSPTVVVFLFELIVILATGARCSFLAWHKADARQLEMARAVGIKARREFNIDSVQHEDVRRRLYFKGLDKCNQIDEDVAQQVVDEVHRMQRSSDSAILRKCGISEFFAMFLTLPSIRMKRIVDQACAKHEKQIECGLHYEGKAMTLKRVMELKEDGSNRQMFEHECVDDDYSPKVYPCLGNTKKWASSCEKVIEDHSTTRIIANEQIERIYESAISRLKTEIEDPEAIFQEAMIKIAHLEGRKCLAFKTMRVCALQSLINNCGKETARAFDTVTSKGYLKSDRSLRLQIDVENFNMPTHPFCKDLL
ncbi:unnamed protein product [Caenorhabditis bovis]|uniref:DUF19 domain-containing protein n=1 Tax=Caenorhabditis bovis TaxID=2654633 RepID=A0A8S1F4H2_9PELO|nr:unnamed protein product [Caenorhabditis bovis]